LDDPEPTSGGHVDAVPMLRHTLQAFDQRAISSAASPPKVELVNRSAGRGVGTTTDAGALAFVDLFLSLDNNLNSSCLCLVPFFGILTIFVAPSGGEIEGGMYGLILVMFRIS